MNMSSYILIDNDYSRDHVNDYMSEKFCDIRTPRNCATPKDYRMVNVIVEIDSEMV